MPRFQLGPYWIEPRKGTRNWQRTWRENGVKQRASLGTPDFEQAKVALAEWYIANAQIRDQQPDDTPIMAVMARYLARHGDHIPSRDTAKRARSLWGEYWGDATVSALTVDAQEEFAEWLRAKEYQGKSYSEGYVRRILSVGKAALNRAWKRQEIVQVPWVDLPPISDAWPHRATDKQLASFLNVIPVGSHIFTYCMIRLNTGCRGDAALDLKPFQVAWDDRLIRLNPPGRKQTKKYRSVVPLTDCLARHLSDIDASPYVNWHGRQIASIKTTWRNLRNDAGLPAWFVPKVLRHTVATKLRAMGVPQWEVSGLIGHKKGGTTEIYAKFDPAYLAQAREALDAWMIELSRTVPAIRGQSGVSPLVKVVGDTGIEPVTPTMSRSRKINKNRN